MKEARSLAVTGWYMWLRQRREGLPEWTSEEREEFYRHTSRMPDWLRDGIEERFADERG